MDLLKRAEEVKATTNILLLNLVTRALTWLSQNFIVAYQNSCFKKKGCCAPLRLNNMNA